MPALDWLLLTKRPQNIRKMLPEDWATGRRTCGLEPPLKIGREPPNACHTWAQCRPRVHFVSAELLLEDWSDLLPEAIAWYRLDWIICGGES